MKDKLTAVLIVLACVAGSYHVYRLFNPVNLDIAIKHSCI